ncbi:MAG TPA: phosphoribosyltransferase family protein [Acidimicrobiales bacterium]|nr:phosphoribosyltransferase family protein [Acidimicrobiales bacterium]
MSPYRGRPALVVLGLPRGGVPVAAEVARALDAPLDVFVVRKLGVPGREELAMGAVATGGVRVLNDVVVDRLRIDDDTIAAVTAREEQELARREEAYRGDRAPLDLDGAAAVLVDDGLATGSTMRAAVAAVRGKGAASVTVAVPCGAEATVEVLRGEADDVICAASPEPFIAVGQCYADFSQTTDDEVRRLVAGG